MMTTPAMIAAVEEWAKTVIPALNTFDHPPAQLSQALPMAIASVATDKVTDQEEPNLPGQAQYQQTLLRTWDVDLQLLVNPKPASAASFTLYEYVDAIATSLQAGITLSGNVLLAQLYDATYDPPEVEYSDGTIARQVTLRLTVGETIGV